MKKAIPTGIAAVFSILGILSYGASHILAAIVLFKHVKLWLFLVMLLVPGVGDVAAIVSLIYIKMWWPFILYGANIVCWILACVFLGIADKKTK